MGGGGVGREEEEEEEGRLRRWRGALEEGGLLQLQGAGTGRSWAACWELGEGREGWGAGGWGRVCVRGD
jgi:hypothetical protein